MKKRPEQTKEQRERDLRFIRSGPIFLRKHKKLTAGHKTKEDFVELLAILWGNLGKLTFKIEKVISIFGTTETIEVRKYKNIPAFRSFNKYKRKFLVGFYGSTLQIARKEGLMN